MHARAAPRQPSYAVVRSRRLFDNRHFLGLLFMLPAAVLLLLFLTYPLGLGVWLGFTDAKIGRPGEWIGIENYEYLVTDSVFRLSVWNTFLYTVIASVIKFALGLWLALLLNEHIPFKAFVRAIVLLPFIVPTVLSAIAFWWIYDAQFSIVSWMLTKMGMIDSYINFLGEPNLARMSVIIANVWRGVPFIAICLLAGLQTISPSLYEAAAIDGANAVPEVLARDAADALADHRGGDDLLGAVHVHRLPADLGADARRPDQCDPPDGHAVLPARDPGRCARRGRGDRHRHDSVPAGGDPVQLFRPAAQTVAAGDEGLSAMKDTGASAAGMNYLVSLPRRVVTVYIPLFVFLFVLLFPFYWMAVTSIKPNAELLSTERQSVLGDPPDAAITSASCCSTPLIRAGCGTRS